MKKAISLIMILAMCLSLCACGGTTPNANSTQNPTEDTTIPEDTTTYYELGETVSTVSVDFTLEDCQFAYYMDGVKPTAEKPSNPYTVEAPVIGAPAGSCFVVCTFTITSKDRVSFEIGDWLGVDWRSQWTVTYGGNVYNVKYYDIYQDENDSWNFAFAYDMTEEGEYVRDGAVNDVIFSGESVTKVLPGIIHVDPESLTDEFLLTVNVRSGVDEYEYFTYRIPARE